MPALAREILSLGVVKDEAGTSFPLHSHTTVAQCEFLQEIMRRIDASICIEIGLAYGISSMFIGEALAGRSAARFISIDPFQAEEWKNIGLTNLKKCGYDIFTEFYSGFSHDVLPPLLASGLKVDFAYVDTSKVFDVVLLDAIYLTRLLRVGGVVVFDDCTWPGVRKMIRYISKWPHLKVLAKHGTHSAGWKRRGLSKLAKFVPDRQRLFRDDVLILDEELQINAHCIALQKIAEDTRRWDWNVPF